MAGKTGQMVDLLISSGQIVIRSSDFDERHGVSLIYSLALAPRGRNQRTMKRSGNVGNQVENALGIFE